MSPVQYQTIPAEMERPSRFLMGKGETDSRVLTREDREPISATAVLEDVYGDFFHAWQSEPYRQSADTNEQRNGRVQDSRITFAHFVETRFIPGHVQFKTLAGRIHYQATLKHLIAPEIVNRMFNPGRIARARLKSVPGWPYLDNVRLCDLGSDHVRDVIRAAHAADYSAQTVKHIKNVLFAVISHAQKEDCFHRPNPASEVKLPKIHRLKQHHLTFEQTKSVLRTLSSPLQEMAIFAISTDMKLGEICDLQWKHVNLSEAERMVDGDPIPARSIAIKRPSNGDGRCDNLSPCKSRNMEIHEPLFSTLKQLSRRNQYLTSDARVILSHEGTPIPPHIKTTLGKQFAKASGLPWLTWQVLRRTRSSFFAEFLSQLSAPRLLDEKLAGKSQFDASEVRSDDPVIEYENALNRFRCRAFCFGRRKQNLAEDIVQD